MNPVNPFFFSSGPSRPSPQPRAPLPPFDLRGPYQVSTTLPDGFEIPPLPTKAFMRGNFSSVVVPGLMRIPGGSYYHPERCLTWALPSYMQADPHAFDNIVYAHQIRGYTHFLQSRGGLDGSLSPTAYAAICSMLKDAGFYVCHMLTSKDTDPHSAPAQTYIDLVRPYLDALLTVGAIDKASVGWEINSFWDPTQLQAFIDWLGPYLLPHGVDLAVHFTTYVTAWQLPGEARAQFWARNAGVLTELWYQTDDKANLGTIQAHGNDVLVPASGLAAVGARPVAFEIKANSQFDGDPAGSDHPNEDDGDMYGFGTLCTRGPISFSGGFMNGCRWPSGAVL